MSPVLHVIGDFADFWKVVRSTRRNPPLGKFGRKFGSAVFQVLQGVVGIAAWVPPDWSLSLVQVGFTRHDDLVGVRPCRHALIKLVIHGEELGVLFARYYSCWGWGVRRSLGLVEPGVDLGSVRVWNHGSLRGGVQVLSFDVPLRHLGFDVNALDQVRGASVRDVLRRLRDFVLQQKWVATVEHEGADVLIIVV